MTQNYLILFPVQKPRQFIFKWNEQDNERVNVIIFLWLQASTICILYVIFTQLIGARSQTKFPPASFSNMWPPFHYISSKPTKSNWFFSIFLIQCWFKYLYMYMKQPYCLFPAGQAALGLRADLVWQMELSPIETLRPWFTREEFSSSKIHESSDPEHNHYLDPAHIQTTNNCNGHVTTE